MHLNALYNSLNELKLESVSSLDDLLLLLNHLSIYDLQPCIPDPNITSPRKLKQERIRTEANQSIETLLRDICIKFNQLWQHDLKTLDSSYLQLYSCFLGDTCQPLFDMLVKVNYEVDSKQILNCSDANKQVLLAIIKKYGNSDLNEDYMWRKLFLYCYMEKKLLLQTLLDECLTLIVKGYFDSLAIIFNVKAFVNLKPLVLVIGFSKVVDIEAARKLIGTLCLNNEKGSLIDRMGSFLKTHLDFIAWFEQIKPENRKKDVGFGDLVKMLHKHLPLNIISQYVEIGEIDNAELTKILRNTLIDKGNRFFLIDTCGHYFY